MKTRIQNIHTTAGETIRHFLGDTESILFFDIETTGLSPKNASIYLIGAAFLQDKKWTNGLQKIRLRRKPFWTLS